MLTFALARRVLRDWRATGPIVVVVGLALAANAALFSVYDGLVARPLPYPHWERIVRIDLSLAGRTALSREDRDHVEVTLATTPLLEERTEYSIGFVFDPTSPAIVDWQVRVAQVSPEMFALAGTRPLLGRALIPEDANEDPRPVVLGHGLWQSRFGADESILASVVDIPGTRGGRRWRVVGVMPPRFDFPRGSNLWMSHTLAVRPRVPEYARLAPGTSIEQLRSLVPQVQVVPLREHYTPAGAHALGLLVASCGLLLLVSATQAAGLLAARAVRRSVDAGVQRALGATRAHLALQHGFEALLLVVAAIVLGLALTPVMLALVVAALPAEMLAGQAVAPDGRTAAFVAALAACCLVLLALVPAVLTLRQSLPALLHLSHARRSTRSRTQISLLVGQLAATVVVVYATGLAYESTRRLAAVDIGFAPSALLAVRMPMVDQPTGGREGRLAAEAVHRDRLAATVSRIRNLDGVMAVAEASSLPVRIAGVQETPFSREDADAPSSFSVDLTFADPSYFDVLQRILTAGSLPDLSAIQAGLATNDLPAVITRSVADYLGTTGPVVGATVETTPGRLFRVVGIVDDWHNRGPQAPPAPAMIAIVPPGVASQYLLIRTRPGHRDAASAAVTAVLADVWQRQAPREIVTGDAIVAAATGQFNSRFVLLALASTVSLAVMSVGIAGAVAFQLSERSRESAIRLAIGASPARVRRSVLMQHTRVTLAAAVLGIAGGAVFGKAAQAHVFGVAAFDVWVAALAGLLVAIPALLVTLLSTRSLGRLDVVRHLQS